MANLKPSGYSLFLAWFILRYVHEANTLGEVVFILPLVTSWTVLNGFRPNLELVGLH